MRNLVLVFVLFTASAVAQCFGLHPVGVSNVLTGTPSRCSDIPGTVTGPFMSLNAAISASAGGNLVFTWSNLPLTGSAPASFATVVNLAFGPTPNPGPSFLPSGGCQSAWVSPGILSTSVLVTNFAGCQGTYAFPVPPLPGFAGVPIIMQGFMYDSIAVAWASSNAINMFFQP